MDARCGACVVKGGKEAKCVSKQWEQTIGEPLGKVCPRVELRPELESAAEVLEFALNERLRPALALRAELVGAVNGMNAEQVNEMLSLVSGALADPDVLRILNPPVDL